MTDCIELLQTLVRQASVTPDDAGCQSLLGERLSAAGFHLEPMRFGAVDNLWARIGNTPPLLVFAGHTDVVPVGELGDWSRAPFSGDIEAGRLHGRGAADMKSGVAAMVTACERFLERFGPDGFDGSLALLLTSDEEGPAIDGTRRVIETLNARDESIDWCVLAEPTSGERFGDVAKIGRRGSLSSTMVVKGIQGHVAYPHLADNPVHRLAPFLDELLRVHWDDGSTHFPPTTLQVSSIQAGSGASNVIPARVTLQFNLRHGTASPASQLRTRIEALAVNHALDVEFDWRESAAPFISEPGRLTHSLLEQVEAHCGCRPRLETSGGTSDGRFIAGRGVELIEFGVRNATIHQVDESIEIEDVISLSAIFEAVIEQLLREE